MIEKNDVRGSLPGLDELKQRLRPCLAELKNISTSDEEGSRFFTLLLNRIAEFTMASGVTIWRIEADSDRLNAIATQGLHAQSLQLNQQQLECHETLIRFAAVQSSPMRVPPESTVAVESEVANPTPMLLLIVPISNLESESNHVIEVMLDNELSDERCRFYLTFLAQFANLVAMWLIKKRLRDASLVEKSIQEAVELTGNVHDSLNPREIAHIAVNDGRTLLNCDRLAITDFDGTRCRMLAVSGQDEFNVRSNVLNRLTRVAAAACKTGEEVWTRDPRTAPQIQRRLDEFVEETHARTVAVIPLKFAADEASATGRQKPERTTPVGAMVVEYFDRDINADQKPRHLDLLVDHTTRALTNAEKHHSIFLLPLWSAIGKGRWLFQRRQLPRTLVFLAIGILLLSMLLFLPVPFEMRVNGELQPVVQRNVFAGSQGVITKVYVEHLQQVEEGQLLAELQDVELDMKSTEVNGLVAQVQKDILSTESGILNKRNLQSDQLDILNQRLSHLKIQLQNLREQQQLLRIKQDRLKVYSPIAGTVISWDIQRRLLDRPVSAKDSIMVIADLNSGWQVQLFIPENKVGHVLDSRPTLKQESKPVDPKVELSAKVPDVRFFATTNPSKRMEGTLSSIENTASSHPELGQTVRGFVDFRANENDPELYVGAAVRAKIDCGKRPLGYAWFHQIIEFVQGRLLF